MDEVGFPVPSLRDRNNPIRRQLSWVGDLFAPSAERPVFDFTRRVTSGLFLPRISVVERQRRDRLRRSISPESLLRMIMPPDDERQHEPQAPIAAVPEQEPQPPRRNAPRAVRQKDVTASTDAVPNVAPAAAQNRNPPKKARQTRKAKSNKKKPCQVPRRSSRK